MSFSGPSPSFYNLESEEIQGVGGNEDYENKVPMGYAVDVIKRICGKVLTLIDSQMNDPIQRKATKDLIKQMFSEPLDDLRQVAYDVVPVYMNSKEAGEYYKNMQPEVPAVPSVEK